MHLRRATTAAAARAAHSRWLDKAPTRAPPRILLATPLLAAPTQILLSLHNCRDVSTWRLAAGGLHRKWKGIKQRTAWRYNTIKDKKNTLIVFSGDDEQKETPILFKLFNRHVDDPMACHNVLEHASVASLNDILSATSPRDSSEFVKTMTGFMLHASAPAMRIKVLDVLTRKRLDDISIENRAVIIRAIQRCLLSPLQTNKPALHTAACNVLLGTFGADLTLLKDLVHASEDDDDDQDDDERETAPLAAASPSQPPPRAAEELPHSGDLSHLLYRNKNVTEVVQVMQHIAVEARVARAQQPQLLKVVSDIDDTLFPGWIDRRYPLYVPYPGVSELFGRISRGCELDVDAKDAATADDAQPDKRTPAITFLTARPRGWLAVGRYITVQHLKSLGMPNATVLNGSVKGLVSNKKIANLKMLNFTRFASLYPEYQFVFFGDSGQGDALLASKLLATFPDSVLATFIHDVNPTSATTGDGQQKSTYKAEGIEFFLTYAGAALAAFHKQLITQQDLLEIVQRAERDLDKQEFTGLNADADKRRARSELESDVEQVLHAVKQVRNPSTDFDAATAVVGATVREMKQTMDT